MQKISFLFIFLVFIFDKILFANTLKNEDFNYIQKEQNINVNYDVIKNQNFNKYNEDKIKNLIKNKSSIIIDSETNNIDKEKIFKLINKKIIKNKVNEQKNNNKINLIRNNEINKNKYIDVNTSNKFEKKNKEDIKNIKNPYLNPLKFIEEKKLLLKIKSKQQIYPNKKELLSLKRFGNRFFINKNTINFNNIDIPEYYIINRGDIINIRIFSYKEKEYELKVDNNGNIYIPSIGKIHLAGLKFSEAKKIITKKLRPTYQDGDIIISLKIQSFIQVSLTGYVDKPGVYNLFSVSTVKDLLNKSEGVGNIGSLRNIYLERNGEIFKKIDFYKLIKDGKPVDNVLLKNGDIVYVPKAEILVKLYGAVKNPAIYELKRSETLKDLLDYSGGILPEGSSNNIKIIRFENNKYVKIFYKKSNSKFKLKDGDIIYVYKISSLNKKYVNVLGNIEKPGRFEIPKDRKLKSLLKKLKFLKNTYYKYGLIEKNKKIISFNLNKPKDIKLNAGDTIYIFNEYEILGERYITLKSNVKHRVSKFRYKPNIRLQDVINLAEFQEPFYSHLIKVTRLTRNYNLKTYLLDLKKDYNFKLKPFDKIEVFSYKFFKPLKPIIIYGEVNNPGIFHYNKGLKLKDLIKLAGNFTDKADRNNIELIRYKIENGIRKRTILNIKKEDLNISLQPFDEIYIKKIPNWENIKWIELKGEFKYPGKYIINNNDRLADIIKRAGGFTKNAYLYGAVYTRKSIKKLEQERLQKIIFKLKRKIAILSAKAKEIGENSFSMKNALESIKILEEEAKKTKPIGRIVIKLSKDLNKFKNSYYNIQVEDGDVLYVPKIKNSILVMGEVLNEGAFVYDTNKAIDYIKKAGGITKDADTIYFVIHANGLTEQGNLNGWFVSSIKVKPGDVIVVPINVKTFSWFGAAKDLVSIIYKLSITTASIKSVGIF